jgi:hypothetical protein
MARWNLKESLCWLPVSLLNMLSNSLTIQFLLGVAGLTQAQTPPNIFPQVANNLAVEYNGATISPGQTVATQGMLLF